MAPCRHSTAAGAPCETTALQRQAAHWHAHSTWMLRFQPPSSRLLGAIPSTCTQLQSASRRQVSMTAGATHPRYKPAEQAPPNPSSTLPMPCPGSCPPHPQHAQRQHAAAQRLARLHAQPAEVGSRVARLPVGRHRRVHVFLGKLVQAQLQGGDGWMGGWDDNMLGILLPAHMRTLTGSCTERS